MTNARPVRRRRLAALIALVAVIAAGLVTNRVLTGSVATDIAGDALYAAVAYTGLVLLWPRARRVVLAGVAAAWCIGVELFQLTGMPALLSARFPPAALVLGSGFDARDLAVYVLAIVAALGLDSVVTRRRSDAGSSH
ncbi:ribosomal maturation YjgA family protein [Microbacterium sp. Leaf179]|uniref:ribosomal maturation YjgA family protein n=1 Tax=Microbacterium sp. Leaf179 TaxID=1736288 RepID=UPI0009E96980|nr:DUF2809 domain-containing protein [Microbacterium sp. Leaf179]